MDEKQRIMELMKKKGWTKYRLAKETGIYITTINSWFNNSNFNPSRESISNICTAMGITLTEFYSGIDETNLSVEQLLVLEKFDKLSTERKRLTLEFLDVLLKEQI